MGARDAGASPSLNLSTPFRKAWTRWQYPLERVLLLGAVLLGVALVASQWGWQQDRLSNERQGLSTLQARLAQLESPGQQPSLAEMQTRGSAEVREPISPRAWPVLNEGVEAWVRSAAQSAASGTGVELQQLTITYPDLADKSPVGAAVGSATGTPTRDLSTAPYALLQISARGSYGALKAWQSDLQEHLPSLAVERLRWQAPANDGTGLLSAQWTWRLWVQLPPVAPAADETTAQALLRPSLADMQNDPFRVSVRPPPAPPVVIAAPTPAAVQVPAAPPPLRWETMGHMQGLDGQHRVTGQWSESPGTVTLMVGDASPRGHRVTAITDKLIELVHPETQERLQFSLPQAPRFERR